MASIEAIEALKESSESWDRHRNQVRELIDLTFAVMASLDLSGRVFDRCNLTGAQFADTNLDHAVIRHSILDGANLANSSLVGACIEDTKISGTTFAHAVLRGMSITRCQVHDISLKEALLEHVRLADCSIERVDLSSARIRATTFDRCNSREWRCQGGVLNYVAFSDSAVSDYSSSDQTISNCSFDRCVLQTIHWERCTVSSTSIRNSTIRSFAAPSSTVSDLDLSRSVVHDSFIGEIGPTTATLIETAFVNCRWPSQVGRTHLFGAYAHSPSLLRQPIQDIRCIEPDLRRDIADAQFLRAKLGKAATLGEKAAMRLWGLTCAYGQSITRLSILCLLAIALHGCLLVACRVDSFNQVRQTPPRRAMSIMCSDTCLAARSFIGFEAKDPLEAKAARRGMLLSVRLLGFVALGIWVSVASNKISKLSAE